MHACSHFATSCQSLSPWSVFESSMASMEVLKKRKTGTTFAEVAPGILREEQDYLKLLYPHPRDDHCRMLEAAHEYFIHGERYECSVTTVWSVFFDKFDAPRIALNCLEKAEQVGLGSLSSSLYNYLLYLQLLKNVDLGDTEVVKRSVASIVRVAISKYDGNTEDELAPSFTVEDTWSLCQDLLANFKKPCCSSCYFLLFCADVTAAQIQELWTKKWTAGIVEGRLSAQANRALLARARCCADR